MKPERIALFSLFLLAWTTLIVDVSWAQADPSWLRSWKEARAHRPDTLTSSGRIAPEDEPGVPLIIQGRIVEPDGAPATGVVVHAYHRDHEGYEFGPGDNAMTTWRLQGWAETDAQGRFEFLTIRPAADWMGREGPHIHFTLVSRNFGRQWAPKQFIRDGELTDGVQRIDVRFRLAEKADF